MLMALLFLPTMGTLIGPRKITKPTENLKALSGKEGDPLKTKGLLGVYVRSINAMIRLPEAIIVASLVVAFTILAGFLGTMSGPNPKPVEFFTDEVGDQIYVLARSRGNETADSQLDIALEVERRIEGIEGIESYYTVTGGAAGGGGAVMDGLDGVPSDTVAKIYTELKPFGTRPEAADIMENIRIAVADMPGIKTEVCLLYTSDAADD